MVIVTFLTISVVTESRSFKLVVEEKTGKERPGSSRLEFLEKVSVTNSALSDAEDNTSGPFTFVENTISNSPKVPRAKFLGSNGLFFSNHWSNLKIPYPYKVDKKN